jgi:hypothetical protein
MPTVFTDARLTPWTAVMPTATRVFPAGDVLTVTVAHTGSLPASAQLATTTGEVLWEGSGTQVENASAARFVVPLERVYAAVCNLIVKTSYGIGRTSIGIADPDAGDSK